jgi:DNA sulfur modification protein DndC
VEAGYPEFEPLLLFRDWLAGIRNDETKRQAIRRNGNMQFQADGTLIPGPFTMETRRDILRRLQEMQATMKLSLISDLEVEAIKVIWAQDMLSPNALEANRQ